jgi:hypothetical protein
MVREGRVLISVSTDPDFGANYYVTAYEVGAQVSGVHNGTGIPVRAGHGFAALDKFIVVSEFPAMTKYSTVTSVTGTQINCASVIVASGDVLVNLGQDTGVPAPNFVDSRGVGFPTAVYTDMDYSNYATNSTVQCDSNGRYRYYHQGISTWELVRSSTTVPFALYQVGVVSTVQSPTVTPVTDNAIVRFDTTSGNLIQNSVVTIGDTGATTGITTLGASGAVTFGSSLAITGALSGVTTLGASGLVTLAAAATVGTTLGVTGATTLSSTLAAGATTITGALSVSTTSTLTGGVVGGKPYMAGTWTPATATTGTSATPTASTLYYGSVFLPMNATLTGIQYLIGTTGNSVVVSLYSSSGSLLANSTTAGTAVGAGSTAQTVAFTGTYAAVGPAYYFIGINFNGNTARYRAIPTYCNMNGVIGGSVAQTFGTPAGITPVTAFTGDVVPVATLY